MVPRTFGAHICSVFEKAGKSEDMAVITEQEPALESSFDVMIKAIEEIKQLDLPLVLVVLPRWPYRKFGRGNHIIFQSNDL